MKNEFDNNLTDKGWQSMRHLLDREMPEQRRRRRFAWWPLALLLLPLAGAGGWWAFRPSKSDKIIQPAAQKPKISAPVVTTESPETYFSNNIAENSEPKSVSGYKRHGFTPKIFGEKVSGSNVLENAQSGWLTIQGEEKPATSDIPGFATTMPAASDNIKPSESEQNILVFEKIAPLAPLVSQQVEPLHVKALEWHFVYPEIKKKNKDRNWTFGVSTALTSEKFSKISGFSVGGAVNWQFARKWGLRSGLQYAQYRLSATERPIVSLDAEKYSDATGNFVSLDSVGGGLNNPSPSVSSPEVLVPVEKLRHLEMPLMVYWQPLRPLRIFGGISTAYTLSAKASSQNYANNQFYYASNSTAQKNLDELTAKTLSRWNTYWQAGVGVRLGRHLEVGAFYKQGFNNLGNIGASQLDASADPNSATDKSNNYFLFNGIWFF